MRLALAALGIAALAACSTQGEPNWRSVQSSVEDWDQTEPDYEHVVSDPVPYTEISDYLELIQSYGWEFVSAEPAGPEFPACYLVISRRAR